jgi:hypothetical protein
MAVFFVLDRAMMLPNDQSPQRSELRVPGIGPGVFSGSLFYSMGAGHAFRVGGWRKVLKTWAQGFLVTA